MLTSTTTGPPAGPPGDRGPRRRLPGWLPWAAAAVAVLALLLVVAKLSGSDTGANTADPGTGSTPGSSQSATANGPSQTPEPSPTKRTSSASSPSSTPSDNRVQVDAGDYVGRPASDARKDLEDLGLSVDEKTSHNPGDKEKDTVADVSPTGLVEPGRTITLSVYDAPPPVEVSPTPTPDVTDPGVGNGNGPGKGDDKGKQKGEKD